MKDEPLAKLPNPAGSEAAAPPESIRNGWFHSGRDAGLGVRKSFASGSDEF